MSWSGAAVFYHQLGVLLKAGLTIAQSLNHAGDAAVGWHRAHAKRWSEGCAAGRSLAEQLAESGEKELPRALIHAGEKSGRVPEMCQEIADFYQHCISLRRAVIGRLIYPLCLTHAMLVIPTLPAVVLGSQPPIALLYGPALFWTIIIAIVCVASLTLRTGAMARMALWFPFRGLSLPLIISNTCLIVRAGINAGMLHHQSLELAAGGCGNRVYRARLRAAAEGLAHGTVANLTQAFSRLAFTAEIVQICQNGEVSGKLEDAMGRAADFQRNAFRERTIWTAKIFTGTLYMLALIAAAITVISMYSKVLAPIAELAQPE